MKRRNFLSTAGIALAASTTATGAVASSVFTDISSTVSLQAFSAPTKLILTNFEKEVTKGLVNYTDKASLVKNLVKPVRIIAQSNTKDRESIVYKNGAGNYIKVSIEHGVERVKISNERMEA